MVELDNEMIAGIGGRKDKIVDFLKRNFRKNIDFMDEKCGNEGTWGGHNKNRYTMTSETATLLNNSC